MEYSISDLNKIKIGDSLVLDIDSVNYCFPDEYCEIIKAHSESLKAELIAYMFKKELKLRLLFKDNNFKKIGIVLDDYKVEKAKSLLAKKGFILIEIVPYIKGTTAIKFDVPLNEFENKKAEIYSILSLVESHFKRRN